MVPVYRFFRSSLAGATMLACLAGLGGCDHFGADELDIRKAASHLPPYQTTVDRPKTLLDRALDQCADKTEARERTCVKTALADNRTSVAELVAMVPGCRLGRVCAYHHKSEDRLGYLPAMAEDFVIHWRVDFDLAHVPRTAADVKITVAQEE